ncbi:carcinoembryonic antigen-related cell adhesion molecule 2 isoform X2 [Ictalurus punctatus]|uniref:Carcinoembryonic antigen-related cell adhesion molecule 2 isoform X2 n=1 Tax=Ictalurus punctatus TaxID=7998 RepID=A0A9F7R616_ICTPU|nr:carcinoembryonic antigen-related cell adhesion molecule 2 isoform X2 [Ictalurus punctatus]
MKMLQLVTILLTLSGVFSDWGVKYPDNPICAVRGFSVPIPCSYYYPTSNPNIQVTQMLWCSMNSNTDKCQNPPYVYNSASITTSDFEYAGDNKSNCTLLIHNVQFSYSGVYKFRFITDNPSGKWTGEPGATLQVADLKVSLIRLSGIGTLKQGDSLNLTCDVNCTQSSSQFVWSKNNERLNTSGRVLHFPAVTVRDSGNYTCTWKTNRASGSETISLHIEGGWGVNYTTPICAVRGFSVSIPCSYSYPQHNYQVTQKLWCSMNSNTGGCENPPYVYNSSSITTSDFEYAGDDKSDCTLLIHNVQFSYSGEYRFRFITNVSGDMWTGEPGQILQVSDLKVSLIRLSGNGTLKQGDSLNLTCDVKCTQSSSQFVWSKNNERLNTSGRVLHFPAVTVRDSGNYTCTWKTNMTSGSETISLLVEGENPDHQPNWIIAVVTSGVIFIILVLLGAAICNRRRKPDAPEDNSRNAGEQTQVKQLPLPNEEVPQQGDVTYASVCIKDNNLNNGRVHTEQKKEDISVIYSTVTIK